MCVDVAYLSKEEVVYAASYGTVEEWKKIKSQLPPTYHANGYDEPSLPVITAQGDPKVEVFDWPFIPFVYAPSKGGRPMNTLNARDDRIFHRNSVYYDAAVNRRCLIMLDGFFDHHHKNKVAYPYFITNRGGAPLMLGGLWQTFRRDDIERRTVSIVTTRANSEMAYIHNEPAYSAESRMVFALQSKEEVQTWLLGSEDDARALIKPLPDGTLDHHPCHPIKSNKKLGRVYEGNVPEIQSYQYYPELEENQGSLF